MSDAEPYEFVVDTESAVPPGEGGVVTGFLVPRAAFKATGAERVDGIDYSAFKINCAFIGSTRQWDLQNGKPWPSVLMFEKWDMPMDLMQMGLDLSILFVNTTDKPQRFAVKFVGKLKR